VVGPGEKDQPFHVDDGVYQFPRPHPNLVCNTMWAVGEFTADNGATRIVPGSNNFDQDPDMTKTYDHIQLEMPPGSIGFVVGTCYHGAGANRTDQDRVGMTINYCNGSMRQQENLMLATHPSRMLTFSEELQNILGFKVCKGAGHIFAGDPRLEMNRHYGPAHADQDWLNRRDEKSAKRAPVGG
jgi:ectoine hydroxylase-related dioxygenase (phytanoyl-CoA dioxygenase family)